MDDAFGEFLGEAADHLDAAGLSLARLGAGPDEAARLGLLRRLHTLKGTAAFFPLPRLAALAHAAEDGALRRDPGSARALLAALGRMRDLVRAASRDGAEPVGDDSRLLAALASPGSAPDGEEGAHLAALIAEMDEARHRLRDAMDRAGFAPSPLLRLAGMADTVGCGMAPELEPVGRALERLPRLARGLEAALAKPFDLVLEDRGAAAGPSVVAALRDALPHLVRNAADHGIEPRPVRLAAGKPARGRVTVAARERGDLLVVTVEDDGAGLDAAAIGRAAACSPSPAEAARLAFRPGLTTAARVTPLSGRGIGLDAVRAGVEALGGTAALRSLPGRGTTCTLTLPRRAAEPARASLASTL